MKDNSSEGQIASLYDFIFNPFLGQVHRSIVNYANKYNCRLIIDIGSGTGAQARALAEKGFSVTGVDASIKMIAVARKKSDKSITFIHDDIISVNIPENTFDAAILNLVLHPNTKETIEKILLKAKTIIKKDGMVFITDYGVGNGFYGKIASGIMGIIESFAKPDHKTNYHAFMKHNGINYFLSKPTLQLFEKKHYFHGALQTLAFKFKNKE